MMHRIDALRDETVDLVKAMKGKYDGDELRLGKGYLDQGFELLRRAFNRVREGASEPSSGPEVIPPDVVG